MQLGFYFDQNRCTGCGTCIVACKDWNDVPAGPESWMRIITIEKGGRHDLFVARLIAPCYHCASPLCAAACPAGAIVKRKEDGIVSVDRERCLGGDACGLCREACPYRAPQFPAGTDSRMRKCDLCLDRWALNKKPICVLACPTRALDAGPLDELRGRVGDVGEAEGFVRIDGVAPSILFKAKKIQRTLPAKAGAAARSRLFKIVKVAGMWVATQFQREDVPHKTESLLGLVSLVNA